MLNTLRSIVQDVAGAGSFREQLDLLVHDVRVALGTEVCSVYLMNRAQDRLLFAANEGLNQDQVGQISLSVDQGLVGLVAERAEPINLNNATVHPRFHLVPEIGEEAFHAFLGVPVIHHRQVLGVLIVQQRERRKFDESEEAFLVTLSAQLAAVIAHAEATGDMEQLFDDAGPGFERADALFRGVGGTPGISMGTAVLIHPPARLEAVTDKVAEDVSTELQVLDRAIASVRNDIRRISEQFAASLPPEELALFDVYLNMLDDKALTGDIRDRVRKGSWAQGALRQVIHEHVRLFEAVEDPYIRERGADVKDLGLRVLAYLQDIRATKTFFPDDTILVGEDVTPGMLAEVPAHKLRGIVSVKGSVTSHLAILAQSLDIPAIMGAVDLPVANLDGQPLIVDGFYGEVICNPSVETVEHYQTLMAGERELALELEELKDFKGVTLDGWRIGLWVNIGLTGVGRSLDRGAEGIGLFRTEIPFMTKERFPSEEEQRAIYREHMEAFDPRPVTMRTLDVGATRRSATFPSLRRTRFSAGAASG